MMTARITEAELETAIDRLITLEQRRHLVAEIRRLRRLLVKLASPDRYLGPQCPRHQGRCCWCGSRIEGVARGTHEAGCPWPELKREALAAIAAGGRGFR